MIKGLYNLIKSAFSKYIFCFMYYIKKHSFVIKPLRIDGSRNIVIGHKVIINYKAWLAANSLTGKNAKLIIGDGTSIGNFSHIYSTNLIDIGQKVLIADKVYISDNLHGYLDINKPIIDQEIIQKNTVYIGEGSWIGENVCIIGASIGRHCVIGANSVVTHDIPDYCVAVGSPAKVIKKFNKKKNKWEIVK